MFVAYEPDSEDNNQGTLQIFDKDVNLIKNIKIERLINTVWNPDSSGIIYTARNGEVYYLDIGEESPIYIALAYAPMFGEEGCGLLINPQWLDVH
jgi:hypothetical protein